MNHWAFIWTAYGLTLAATLGLLGQSIIAMRTAENGAQTSGERN
jgi:heme exporter protein CcmD